MRQRLLVLLGQIACALVGVPVLVSAESAASSSPAPTFLSISDAFVDEGDYGTTDAVFDVTVTPASTQIVSVKYTTVDDTAEGEIDYRPISGVVAFYPGETRKAVRVAAIGNGSAQPNRQFRIELFSPENAVITKSTGIGWILDDDSLPLPSLVVGDAFLIEGNPPSRPQLQFVVSSSGASKDRITVAYSTADGLAVGGKDYNSTSGQLTFEPGETNRTVQVEILSDLLSENDEWMHLHLANPANATIGDEEGIGTITDDDPALLSVEDASVFEGDTGTFNAVFHVRLANPCAEAVSVQYTTVDGTARAGVDYIPTQGVATFSPGEGVQSIEVRVIGNRLWQTERRFYVELATPENGVIGRARAEGAILDDDPQPVVAVSSPAAVVEGGQGTVSARFTVTLSEATSQTVTVDYITTDSFDPTWAASAGKDYWPAKGTLTFEPGETSKTIEVAVIGDTIPELDETFWLSLASTDAVISTNSPALGIIRNDDFPPEPPTISPIAHQTIREDSAAGPIFFRIEDPDDAAASLQVSVTSSEPGLVPDDDLEIRGVGSDRSLVATPTPDQFGEGAITLVLRDAAGLAATNRFTLTVLPVNDAPSFVKGPDQTVADTAGMQVIASWAKHLRAGPSNESGQTLSFEASVDNPSLFASPPVISPEGTLTFAPAHNMEGVAKVTVVLRDDGGTAAGGVDVSDPQTFSIVVTHTNQPPVVSEIPNQETDQNTPTAAISFSIHDLETAAGKLRVEAFSSESGLIPGNTSANIVLGGSGTNRTITLTPDRNQAGTATITVRVTDDGAPPLTASRSFEVTVVPVAKAPPPAVKITDAGRVTEGDAGLVQALFTVGLTAPSPHPVTIHYATGDFFDLVLTATAGEDYRAVEGVLTFDPGQTNKTVAVEVMGDLLHETNEVFVVSLTEAEPGEVTIEKSQAQGIIVNDDAAPSGCPNVIVLASSDGQTCFNGSASIHILASPDEASDQVVLIEFYEGDTLLGADSEGPFEFVWEGAPVGELCLSAKAVCKSGSTVMSEPFCLTVTESGPGIGIIQNFDDPEIDALREYLLEMGYCTRVLDQQGLEMQDLSAFELLIWNDLGADGLTDSTVQVLAQFFETGRSLLLIGDRLVASASGLSPAEQATWLHLLHLTPVSGPQVPGQIAFSTAPADREPGTVLSGAFGEVADFQYTNRVADAIADWDATPLGFAGSSALLVRYPAADVPDFGLARSISQRFRTITGGGLESVLSRKALFQNSVFWLLQRSSCPFVYLSLQTSEDVPAVVNVGDEFTFTLTVGNNGECVGTGTVVTNRFPAGLELVHAAYDRGISADYNPMDRTLIWRVGSVASGTVNNAVLSLTVRAVQPGLFHNFAVTTAIHEELTESNFAEFDVQVEGVAPEAATLRLLRLDDGRFACLLSGVPGTSYVIQGSPDLLTWTPLATVRLKEDGIAVYHDLAGTDVSQRFYRAVQTP